MTVPMVPGPIAIDVLKRIQYVANVCADRWRLDRAVKNVILIRPNIRVRV